MGGPSLGGRWRIGLWCTTLGADPVFRRPDGGFRRRVQPAGSAGRALAEGPVEGGCRRGLVLEADVALVAELAAAGDPVLKRKVPGAGGSAAGGVRDLDVAEVA